MDDEQLHAMDGDRGDEDASRVRRYLEGESKTFREVDGWARSELSRQYPRLWGEHDDLCQIVHSSLLKNLRAGKFEGRASLRHYVTGIAHYTAIARLRELYRHGALSESLAREPTRTVEDNPYRTVDALDRGKLLRQLLLSLPDECRQLWRMVFSDKLTYAEVAEKIGAPLGTIKSQMWHCRRKAMAIVRRIRSLGIARPRRPPKKAP